MGRGRMKIGSAPCVSTVASTPLKVPGERQLPQIDRPFLMDLASFTLYLNWGFGGLQVVSILTAGSFAKVWADLCSVEDPRSHADRVSEKYLPILVSADPFPVL